jgi:WD40 repeat protein
MNKLVPNVPQKQVFSELSNEFQWIISNETVNAWTVTFSPDSKLIATGSHSGKIILYSVGSGEKSEHSLDSTGKFTLSIAFVSILWVFPFFHI